MDRYVERKSSSVTFFQAHQAKTKAGLHLKGSNNSCQCDVHPCRSPGKGSPQHKRSILLHQRLCAVQPIDHHLKATEGKQVLCIIHLQQRQSLVQSSQQEDKGSCCLSFGNYSKNLKKSSKNQRWPL